MVLGMTMDVLMFEDPDRLAAKIRKNHANGVYERERIRRREEFLNQPLWKLLLIETFALMIGLLYAPTIVGLFFSVIIWSGSYERIRFYFNPCRECPDHTI